MSKKLYSICLAVRNNNADQRLKDCLVCVVGACTAKVELCEMCDRINKFSGTDCSLKLWHRPFAEYVFFGLMADLLAAELLLDVAMCGVDSSQSALCLFNAYQPPHAKWT